MNLNELTKEQLLEESLVDLAYQLLTDKQASMPFEVLLDTLRKLTGLTKAQMDERLLQFYTDINIDGRFLLNQEDGWGLREWYKVEQIEEETAPSVKARKKKKKTTAKATDVLEDDELEDEEEFDEDIEEFVEDEDDEDDDTPIIDPVGFGKDDEDEEEEDDEIGEDIEDVVIDEEEIEFEEEDEDDEDEEEEE